MSVLVHSQNAQEDPAGPHLPQIVPEETSCVIFLFGATENIRQCSSSYGYVQLNDMECILIQHET